MAAEYCENDGTSQDSQDDWLEVYATGKFNEFSDDAFDEYHDCDYYQTHGGGSEGGYLVRWHQSMCRPPHQEVFKVERNWFEKWSIVRLDEGHYVDTGCDGFIRLLTPP